MDTINKLLPVADIVKVKTYKDIYKNEKWWMTVAIVQIKGFYKIKLYQFYNKDGKWQIMKDFSFNDIDDTMKTIEVLKEAVIKLGQLVKEKQHKKHMKFAKIVDYANMKEG
ncbi:MAG: hypothetical protein ACPLKS_08040 [Caldisericum exile]|uniref:hypothetical protein n=1 Tax=Caldisericum exile TaxID=693075 RepID=UPI003C77C5D3